MAYNQINTRPGSNVMEYRPRNFSEFATDLALKQQLLQELREAQQSQMFAQQAGGTYSNVPKWGQANPPAAATTTTPAVGAIEPPAAVSPFTGPATGAPVTPSRTEGMLQRMRQQPQAAPQAPAGGGYGTMSPEIDEEMRRRERIRKMLGQ